jgi:hypothetical protein
MDQLLSVEEAAAKPKLAPKTLRDRLRTSRLPDVKLGKRCPVREQDLQAAIEVRLRSGRATKSNTAAADAET